MFVINDLAEKIRLVREGTVPVPKEPVFLCKRYPRIEDEAGNKAFAIVITSHGMVFRDYSSRNFSYFTHDEALDLLDRAERWFMNLFVVKIF